MTLPSIQFQMNDLQRINQKQKLKPVSYLGISRWYLWGFLCKWIRIIRIFIISLGAVFVRVVDHAGGWTRWSSAAVDHGHVGWLPAGRGLHGSSLGLHGSTPRLPHLKCGESVLHTAVIDNLLLGLFWKDFYWIQIIISIWVLVKNSVDHFLRENIEKS